MWNPDPGPLRQPDPLSSSICTCLEGIVGREIRWERGEKEGRREGRREGRKEGRYGGRKEDRWDGGMKEGRNRRREEGMQVPCVRTSILAKFIATILPAPTGTCPDRARLESGPMDSSSSATVQHCSEMR
jgi:hypothetical protein